MIPQKTSGNFEIYFEKDRDVSKNPYVGIVVGEPQDMIFLVSILRMRYLGVIQAERAIRCMDLWCKSTEWRRVNERSRLQQMLFPCMCTRES